MLCRLRWVAFALLLANGCVFPVRAQSMAEIARLTGANRETRLIAGAKKEGTLTLYSSAPTAVMTAVTAAFTRKYGVKVELWRGGSEQILQRVMTEARGGRAGVDVMETAGPEIEAVNRANLLQIVETPMVSGLIPEAYVRTRPWIVSRLSVFVIAYNTRLVRPAEAPKTLRDLADPKWKGKLGLEADDSNWLMSVSGALGGDAGLALFRDVVAKNGISVRKGHTLLANLVASGEVPVALDAYLDEVSQLKKAGAPIEAVFGAPVIAMPTAVAVFKNAVHPHAAVLFMDYLLSEEGQALLALRNVVPSHAKLQRLAPGVRLVFMDSGKFLDEHASWTRTYRDIFLSRGR
jgi:iron(III) transport system substrate-binding protein